MIYILRNKRYKKESWMRSIIGMKGQIKQLKLQYTDHMTRRMNVGCTCDVPKSPITKE